ncbi:hypothetical protein BJX68DRAFT_79693 [Aspergillus pseudodeflectus]|uniref:Uncharacterized protein n=1 Tax=Aspergillus pseudodeflectus TaxID=176178 RepID=A0ABR4L6N1_9EURO
MPYERRTCTFIRIGGKKSRKYCPKSLLTKRLPITMLLGFPLYATSAFSCSIYYISRNPAGVGGCFGALRTNESGPTERHRVDDLLCISGHFETL